jgi:hypothetical protein
MPARCPAPRERARLRVHGEDPHRVRTGEPTRRELRSEIGRGVLFRRVGCRCGRTAAGQARCVDGLAQRCLRVVYDGSVTGGNERGTCCDGVIPQEPLTCPNCGQIAWVQAITAVVSAGLTVGTSAGHSADVGRALFILLLILLLILLPIVVAFAGIRVAQGWHAARSTSMRWRPGQEEWRNRCPQTTVRRSAPPRQRSS